MTPFFQFDKMILTVEGNIGNAKQEAAMNKSIKSKIRKMTKGNHTMTTIKRYLSIETDEYDEFIKSEFGKKRAKQIAQPAYAGRNIRYQ